MATHPTLAFLVPAEEVEAFSQLLNEVWGHTPARTASAPVDLPRTKSLGDPTLWITLLVALPSAVKATIDLNDRFKITERLRRLIAKVRAAPPEDPRRNILIKLPDGRTILLFDADPAEIIQLLPNGNNSPNGTS